MLVQRSSPLLEVPLQLENFHQVLTELSTLPVPARWSEQPKPHLPHPELPSHLYHYLLRKLGRTLPRPPYESSDRVGRVIGEAWSEVRTLFVSRQRLEVVGILRQMVANITAAIQQVLTRYSDYIGCVYTRVLITRVQLTCGPKPSSNPSIDVG